MTTQLKTATKEELIEALQELPDGALVAFSSDYGDICHTQQIHTLRGNVEPVAVTESAYSASGFAVADGDDADWSDDDDNETEVETPEVYILS
jgi:hypothetical protein